MSGNPFPPDVSCRAVVMSTLYFERKYGRERLESAWAQLKAPVTLEWVRDPNNFISFDFAVRYNDVLCEASGDPRFSYNCGLTLATPEALGFGYYMFRALGSPRMAYELLVKVAGSVNKIAKMSFDSIAETQAVLRYQSERPEPNRHLCEGRMGQFASLPTIWGLPAATVRERECQVQGASACVYELAWQPNIQPVLAGLAGVAIGAPLGALLLASYAPLAAAIVLGVLVCGSAGMALGYRAQARQKARILAEQPEGLALSLRDLQVRYDEIRDLNATLEKKIEEIRDLNATLEKKVEERTRQLSLMAAKLQAALDKQVELDRLKTNFFQNVSHELRTPLTLILAPLDSMLSEESSADTATRKQLELMRRSAVRLLGLINSLLDLSRLDAGRMRLQLEPTDPAALVRRLSETALALAQQRGIALEVDAPESMEAVALDNDKFEKAVINLVSNALKFTGAESTGRAGRVRVAVRRDDGWLAVSVADNGIGIPAEELSKIFQRFHQVDGSDQRRFGGTGIGLALVKELVEFHCGTVEVESRPGEGSTFTLRFPVQVEAYPEERLDRRRMSADVAVDRRREPDRQKLEQLIANAAELALEDLRPPAPAPAESRPTPDADERPVVLVADDNPDMLAYLTSILARDYRVVGAQDGEETVELAVRTLPAIIVSDVMMPRKSGYQVVQELRRLPQTRSTPIILVTAKAEPYQKVAGIEYGADDYLTKPFNFLELRARLKQLLRTRALERSLAEKNDYLEKLNFDLVLSKKEVFLQTVEALVSALEAKDPYTHGHSRRVAALSVDLAREVGMSELEVERLRVAATLHDVGKIGIREDILLKKDPLTPEEMDFVRQHPEMGFRILESVKELADVGRCILLHHERYDGGGYPLRRKGEEIPLEARILAVVDCYDAMTSDRPYRRALGHQQAVDELRRFSGTQFDPEVVRAFLRRYGSEPPQAAGAERAAGR